MAAGPEPDFDHVCDMMAGFVAAQLSDDVVSDPRQVKSSRERERERERENNSKGDEGHLGSVVVDHPKCTLELMRGTRATYAGTPFRCGSAF